MAWTRLSRAARLLLSARPDSLGTTSLQIRLTLSLLSALIPLFFLMTIASAWVRTKPIDAYGWICGIGAIAFAGAAAMLAVRGRSALAARVLSGTNIVFAFLVALDEDEPLRAASSFLFALVGVLWSSFLLPPRDTTLAVVATLLLAVILPAVHPSLDLAHMVLPLFFCSFASTFLVVVGYLRQRHFTELERRNAQLLEGEQQLRVTMDSSLDAVITCSGDGMVSDWSRQAEVVFGTSKSEALWREVTALAIDEQDAERVRELVRERARAPGSSTRVEVKGRRRDGTVFPAELSASGLTLRGRPACAIFVRDISERRQMQAELIQSDRLVSVGRLAAGVAHEINNPMTYVLANLQYAAEIVAARRGELGTDGPELDEVLADAAEGAGRVHSIVKDLRTFSHASNEDRVPVHLGAVLDSAAHLAWNEIRHRARLVKRYEENVPPVMGNAGRLGQVFLNLIVNAVQALSRDGRDHEIRLELRQEGTRVVASVSDTGEGIPAEIRERMFLPFVTTKKAGEGTGLGLYISRNIVGALGGDIEVTSVPHVGTTFDVSFPALAPVVPQPAEDTSGLSCPAVAIATEPPLSILLVDDDDAVLRSLQRMLGNHRLTAVGGGVEALDVCTRRRFDLVLCDVMMTGMNGVELAKRLFDGGLVSPEQLYFVTGGAFTPGEHQYLSQHPDRLLDKPVDVRKLNEILLRASRALPARRAG